MVPKGRTQSILNNSVIQELKGNMPLCFKISTVKTRNCHAHMPVRDWEQLLTDMSTSESLIRFLIKERSKIAKQAKLFRMLRELDYNLCRPENIIISLLSLHSTKSSTTFSAPSLFSLSSKLLFQVKFFLACSSLSLLRCWGIGLQLCSQSCIWEVAMTNS